MKILGIHAGRQFLDETNTDGASFHDAAAVLVTDGVLSAAIEEERLTRMKHCNCFPANAIQFCLDSTKTGWHQIDKIAINQSQFGATLSDTVAYLEDPQRRALPGAENHFAALFERAFGVNVRGRLEFCHHHLAHAWSAFIPSGFDRALIVSLDGEGDNCSGMVLTANGLSLETIKEYSVQQSLGNLYTAFIGLIGYGRFDEYKVMGLAPYGDPQVFGPALSKCYHLLPEGNYALEPTPVWLRVCDEMGVLTQARRKGQPFSQVHKDLAAAIQQVLETIVLHLLQFYRAKTGERNLCLVGGVAHNCTMNGKVLASGLFDHVFAQPLAHDAGGALGAALWSYYQHEPDGPHQKLTHLYYGTDVSLQDNIEAGLERWSGFIDFQKHNNIAAECAALLAEDAVIGWIQGRSEFGPRALGNRSILADPRPARNKTRINDMVKKREGYRPFAPSVLEEKLTTFFEVPPGCSSLPFMIFVVPVREEYREQVAAVTHIDGTARVQSVSRADSPIYWDLIAEFERLTGIGMLLNTSFNNNAEPIVDSIDDAVVSFLTTDLSYLAIGPYLICRRPEAERRTALLGMRLELPLWRKLVKRQQWSGHTGTCEALFQLESIKGREFGAPVVPISPKMFLLLQSAGNGATIGELMDQTNLGGHRESILNDLVGLWSQRAVLLSPLDHSNTPVQGEVSRRTYGRIRAHSSAAL